MSSKQSLRRRSHHSIVLPLCRVTPGYIHTILSDSLVYASHAHPSSSSNPQINLPDLILAIQSNLSHSLIQQPSKSALLSLASSLNSTPLPPISERFGLRLPPREHCLTNVNFTIVPDELDDEDDEEHEGEAEEGQAGAGAGNDPATTANGSHDVGEEDANSPDVSMQDATATDEQPPPPPDQTTRGVKRSLQEDDEYD